MDPLGVRKNYWIYFYSPCLDLRNFTLWDTMMKTRIIWMMLLTSCFVSFAADYIVSSASEITSAMQTAQPGDTLTMQNGVWMNERISFEGNGAEGDSIVLRAETPGHVVLTGTSRLEIDGTYLKVDGLRFIGGSNSNGAIEFDYGSQHCRVTNTLVAEYNPSSALTRYHWIQLQGAHHRLDHCFFTGMRHSGVSVIVKLNNAPYGHHRIDHNIFSNKPEGNGNGYESIKISAGAYSDLDGNTTVEYNYFYRCNGEVEIISNKCHYNIYRYNTFMECQGTLTLRQGMNCLVEGNYFFGNHMPDTGGIRITHRGHMIVNNYFQELTGTGNKSAISLYTGIGHSDYYPGRGGHVRADSILVAHNTIVNCATGIVSGVLDDDDKIRLAPRDNIYANNLIFMNDNAPCFTIDSAFPGINPFWQGNLFSGSNPGDMPDSGYAAGNPDFVLTNGWYQIGESSAAIDAAVGTYPLILEDIDGNTRGSLKDIGADEYGSGPRQPLQMTDVGPIWQTQTDLPFALVTYTYGSGTIVTDPPGGIYKNGTKVTLQAIPESGWTFEGWTGDVESVENPIGVIMDTTKVIRATFTPPLMYAIVPWITGSGRLEYDPPGNSYPPGAMVRVTAIADEGWEFDHWGNDLSGSVNPDTLLMDGDRFILVAFKQTTGIEEQSMVANQYQLHQNYPNPFNPVTTIEFSLAESGMTTLQIYDISGQQVATLIRQHLGAGSHSVQFDASSLASGVYYYKITSGSFSVTKKMILMK
ncbi:T9SS type A sorting domain-containing protein [candidate division KSB1 bacterium]|nr:T9SS type A sorting domain-containing protein [candidate division KSB1 bacterium]